MEMDEIIGKDVEEEVIQELTPEADPQIKKINELLRSLLMNSSNLVFEVAVCNCPNGNGCGVLRVAREIAKVMNELRSMQDVAMKYSTQQAAAEEKEGSKGKKGGRKRRGGA